MARGQVVLDQAFSCEPDALFFLFSASKPLVALAMHVLAERAALSLDDRVARYWPAFGQRGKGGITIRHVLQHRGGLPVARTMARDPRSATTAATSASAGPTRSVLSPSAT